MSVLHVRNHTVTDAAWRISVPKSVYKKKNKNFCKCQEKILDSKAPFVYDSQGDVMESIVKQSSEIFNDEITATTDTTSFEDFKKSELEAYAQELEAEQKGITSSALEKQKGA